MPAAFSDLLGQMAQIPWGLSPYSFLAPLSSSSLGRLLWGLQTPGVQAGLGCVLKALEQDSSMGEHIGVGLMWQTAVQLVLNHVCEEVGGWKG